MKMKMTDRVAGHNPSQIGKWLCALLLVSTLVFFAKPTMADCQLHVPMANSVTNIDGIIDSEWDDASISLSGIGCFSVFNDGSKSVPTPRDLKVYTKQDSAYVYLALDVPDSSGAPLGLSEKIILQFDANPVPATSQLTVDSRKLVITSTRTSGAIYDTTVGSACPSAPCSGSKAYYKGTGTRQCSGSTVPFWQQFSWPNSISVGLDNTSSPTSYKVEFKIPKTEIAVVQNDIIRIAFIVINDLGTTTGNTEDAFAARFPSDLPVSAVGAAGTLTNPADPTSGCSDWIKPLKWGIAAANLSGDVYIRKGNPAWVSDDIDVFSCQANYTGTGDAYNYYPDKPCRFKVRATLHNSSSSSDFRDVLVVVSPHGTGQPTWEVIDLIKNVQVTGYNGTAPVLTSYYDSTRPPPLANDGGYLPKAYVNQGGHPCVKVYVLPTSDNPSFPKSRLTDGTGLSDNDLQNLVNTYGLSDGVHVAQQNISRTATANCANATCQTAALEGPVIAAVNEQPFNSGGIILTPVGWNLISDAYAQQPKFSSKLISGNMLERYGNNNVILSIAAFAYPTGDPPKGPAYRIIEPIGGVIQLFPASMLREQGSLPIKLLVGNTQTTEQTIYLTVQAAHYPPGLEDLQQVLPREPIVLGPGKSTLVVGQVGKPCKCGDLKCHFANVKMAYGKPETLASSGLLVGVVGVGGFAFLRRKRKATVRSSDERIES